MKITVGLAWGLLLSLLPISLQSAVLPADTLAIREQIAEGDGALETGAYQVALKHYFAAMDQMDSLAWPKAYLEAFYSVAYCYQAQGRLQDLIELRPRINPYLDRKTDPYLSDVLLALGNTYRHNRLLNQALDLNQQAISLAPKDDPDYWLTLADAYNNQGILYRLLGEPDQALLQYQEALRYFVKEGEPRKVAQVLTNQALLHRINKQYPLAEAAYQQALDTLRAAAVSRSTLHARLHDGWGNLLLETGQPETARKHYQLALDNLRPQHFLRGSVYRHLGQSFRQTGQLNEAQKWFGQALRFRNATYRNKHTHKAISHRDLGNLALDRQLAEEALTHYQRSIAQLVLDWEPETLEALPPLRALLSGPEMLKSLQAKAEAWVLLGELQADSSHWTHALETYQLAIKLVDSLQAQFWGEESKLLLSASTNPLYEEAIALTLRLHKATDEKGYLETAYQLAARQKAAVLREQLRISRAGQVVPAPMVRREKELRYRLDQYEVAVMEFPDSTALHKARFAAYQAHLALLDSIDQLFPAYAQIKKHAQFQPASSLQGELGPSELLVEFFWGEQEVQVFGLSQEQLVHHPVTIDRDSLRLFLQELTALERAESGDEAVLRQYQQSAFEWYAKLLAPILKQLSTQPSHLILVPDGLLGYLPFESLCTSAEPFPDFARLPYLFQQFTIQYLYSAHLLQMSPRERADRTFLAFAPTFQGPAAQARSGQVNGGALDNQVVPTTVAERWAGVAYVAEQAIKTRLLAEGGDYQVLHLGTHGFIDEENPSRSGLYFQEEEPLFAYEIYHQNFPADLAVLSACETGTGQLATGEGIYSLARAFTAAGCASTVMSLWKVDDQSTRDLMMAFYEALDQEQTTAEALQTARQQFLETHDRVHPYYWSAFVLIGQNQAVRPVPRGGPLWLRYLILLGITALLFSFSLWRTTFAS